MNADQFYDNYRDFLERSRNLPKPTIESYVAYLRNANDHFSPLPDKSIDCFVKMEDDPWIQNRIDFVKYMIAKAKTEKQNPLPVIPSRTLSHCITAMNALLDYYENLDSSSQAAQPKPTSIRKAKKTRKIERRNIPPLPFLGEDDDCEHVYYDQGIPQGERVPGLAAHLENHYGRIIEFLMHALKPDFNDYWPKKIDVVLTKGHPAKAYPIDVVARVLRQWNLSNHALSAPQIIKMLKEDAMVSPILGMYSSNKNNPEKWLITIYYENASRLPIESYFALFESVLCHEYAHHIHRLYLGDYFISQDETVQIIKESIADFSSFCYCGEYVPFEKELGPVAQEKLDGWQEYFGSGWPYAEALWFLHVDDDFALPAPPVPKASKYKLVQVFHRSGNYALALDALER